MFALLSRLLKRLVHPLSITQDTSDGSHTFRELYAHRRALTAVLTAMLTVRLTYGPAVSRHNPGWPHRSLAHHPDDKPMFEGYFIVVFYPFPDFDSQCSYHYELEHWDDFSHLRTRETADKWNGHSSTDVCEMLFHAR